MKAKHKLLVVGLIIPFVLTYMLSGGQIERNNFLSTCTFSLSIFLGYSVSCRTIKNKFFHLIFIVLLSLSLGIIEANLLNKPVNIGYRIVGQTLFNFIGIFWLGADIKKRKKEKERKNE